MKKTASFLMAALALGGCTSVDGTDTPEPPSSTPRERAAEGAVRQYFRHLAAYDLPAAYDLLSLEEQKKVPFEKYKEWCVDREAVTGLARAMEIKYSGEGEKPLPTGAPYVLVIVQAAGVPDMPAQKYRAVPESGRWRVILPEIPTVAPQRR
jgi:hypothetical protein